MAIDAVTIGPFKGGLNNVSQAGEASDTELVEMVNMGVTVDGAITSRLPMHEVKGISGSIYDAYEVLGIYRQNALTWYLIFQERNGTGWDVKAAIGGDMTAPVVIRTTINEFNKVSAYVQVKDFGYFCASPGESAGLIGFKWKPATAYVEIPAMPRGECMVSFKNRLWITGTDAATTNSTMWFSTIDSTGIKVETWNTSVDYFEVAPGEGGYITALIALNSSLVVFKNDGTWRFSYATSPSKGIVDKISGTIGAANKNVVVEFNSLVYSYDQGRLYELVNNTFSPINREVAFREDTEAIHSANGTELSAVGMNLVLRYFNALYVYNSETGTWCQWRSKVGIPGKFIELPADSNSSKPSTYIAPSRGFRDKKGEKVKYGMIWLEGEYSDTPGLEEIECVIRTKSYDYKAPAVYKRLFWWGMDHKSYLTFTATVIPTVKKRMPTWGELKAAQFTWGNIKPGTWGDPYKGRGLNTSVSDSFDVSSEHTDNGRIFSKIKKSLRFRQVAYEVRMLTNGDKQTGPVKIFSFVTYVTAKHNVVDKNN